MRIDDRAIAQSWRGYDSPSHAGEEMQQNSDWLQSTGLLTGRAAPGLRRIDLGITARQVETGRLLDCIEQAILDTWFARKPLNAISVHSVSHKEIKAAVAAVMQDKPGNRETMLRAILGAKGFELEVQVA